MKNQQYNRIQIYLDDETAALFQAHCKARNTRASAEAKRIIIEAIRGQKEEKKVFDKDDVDVRRLQERVTYLEGLVKHNEKKIDIMFEAKLKERIEQLDSIGPFLEKHSQSNYNDSQSNLQLTNTDIEAHENDIKSLETQEAKELEESEIQKYFSPIEEVDNVSSEPLSSEDNKKVKKSVLTQAKKTITKTIKSKAVITKDIKALNDSGGIQIAKEKQITDTVLEEYFLSLLQGRFVLQATNEQNVSFWIAGARHTKPSEKYLEARLYHSKSRMKVAIPKLEKKFSIQITSLPAIDFLRNLPSSERAEIITNWGVEFTFID